MDNDRALQQALHSARDAVSSALQAHAELHSEISKLFSGESDEGLVIARARRLLEVLVVDHYITTYEITPPYKDKLKPLYDLIETMRKDGTLSHVLVSLCHEVRLIGNRALHYRPENDLSRKLPCFNREDAEKVVLRCAEIAESLLQGEQRSVYGITLSPPFDAMYQHFMGSWHPVLQEMKEGPFPLTEVLELLLRSAISAMRGEWITILERYESNHDLPARLPVREEDALRQLRNLGMISHEGEWLFTPTRSASIRPTSRGLFLCALRRKETSVSVAKELAVEVVRDIQSVGDSPELRSTLMALLLDPRIKGESVRKKVRKLRNLNMVGHREQFLAGSKEVFITTLGYYVAGKYAPD